MKLSIVVPCYNEVSSIELIVTRVKNCPYRNKEIILVDDCSTDGTREKLRNEIEKLVDNISKMASGVQRLCKSMANLWGLDGLYLCCSYQD